MKLVRGSEVQDYLRCRKRWSYRWVEKLQALKPNGKLFFGNLFHKFVQEYYAGFNRPKWEITALSQTSEELAFEAMKKLFEETDTHLMEQTELNELWDLAETVTENYVKQWKVQDQDITVLATELNFAIPLDENIVYEGTIDMVYMKDGKLYFKDYKTVARVEQYREKAEMDRQISRYWWALQQLARGNGYIWDSNINVWNHVSETWCQWFPKGIEPSGFIYDIVLKDYPTPPDLLKKGGLSKAKAQKTTYAMYMQALIDNGIVTQHIHDDVLVPEEYAEILQHLSAQETEFGNRYLQRIPVSRNQAEVDAAINEFYWIARESQDLKKIAVDAPAVDGDHMFYRNITDDCSWDCEFKMLCVAEMAGENSAMIRGLAYKTREDETNKWQDI